MCYNKAMKKKFAFISVLFLLVGVNLFADSVGLKVSEQRKKVVMLALEQGGKPYVWGSTDPKVGFDCSGLIYYVYSTAAGKKLPRTAKEIYGVCQRISPDQREPGDLMFFWDGGSISHVGIYCGKYTNHKNPNSRLNGKVVFISAMSEGQHKGVKIADIEAPYWKKHFYCYGRILPPSK